MTTPEARSLIEIDRLLTAAGWYGCDYQQAELHAVRGVVIREFPLEAGHGDADHLFFYMDGDAAGLVEGNKHRGRPTSPHASSIPGGFRRPS